MGYTPVNAIDKTNLILDVLAKKTTGNRCEPRKHRYPGLSTSGYKL